MRWRVALTLDGIDRSSLLVGRIAVTAEETTARIASWSLKTPSGAVTPSDWLGVSAMIDFQTVDASGTVLTTERIFTGTVDQAIYDIASGLTEFQASDGLQAHFEAMDQATVEATITGWRWSSNVFGEFEDGWRHLNQLLETVPASVEFDRTGTLVQTDWAAKTTSDFSFSQSQIVNGSVSYSLSPRRDLANQIAITYQHRFTRRKHREHSYSWSMPGTFCTTYFLDSFELPTRQMVQDSADGSGWSVQDSITFTKLPASAADPCGIGVSWSISDQYRDTLIQSASWTGVRRWTQEATETYTLTVTAPQSVTWLGSVPIMVSVSAQSAAAAVEGWMGGTDTPTGTDVRVDAHGDYVIDDVTRADVDNDIETLIARSRVQMLDAHRANLVQAQVELSPTLELSHTVYLDAGVIVAQGKAQQITHEMDIDAGSALTTVRIAVSQNGNQAPITDDAISAPTAPSTDPAVGPPSTSTTYPNHLAKYATDPADNTSWDGFIGNYTVKETGAPDYNRRFVATGADVNQEAIDHVEGTAAQTYNFDIPHDTLTITAP